MPEKPTAVAQTANSTEQARFDFGDALASVCLEGYVPTAAFMADGEALVSGLITAEQMRANILRRAQELEESNVAAAEKHAP
ncbi:MAG: hypothetical protein ACRDAM_22155 [Casimicrobium sp.]